MEKLKFSVPLKRKNGKNIQKFLIFLVLFSLLYSIFKTQNVSANQQEALAGQSEIIVSEFMANPKAVSDNKGEWLELYNRGPERVDLKNWTMEIGSGQYLISQELLIEAGGYVVICKNSNPEENGGILCSYQIAGLNLVNSGGQIKFKKDSLSAFELEYSAAMVAEGKSSELKDFRNIAVENFSVAENWQTCSTEMESHDFGTPGNANSFQQILSESPPTEDSSENIENNFLENYSETETGENNEIEEIIDPYPSNASAEVFLTKTLPNPAGIDNENNEFIEIYNPNSFPVNLFQWKLSNKNGQSYVFEEPFVLESLESKIIYRQNFKFNLYNSDGSISLFDKDNKLIDKLSFGGSAKEGEVLNKKPEGEIFWASLNPTSSNNSENGNTEFSEAEGDSAQNFPLKITELNQLNFLSNLAEVSLSGMLVSPVGIPEQNSFYLQCGGRGILIKTAGGILFKPGDLLNIKKSVLHQTQKYNYLKVSDPENIERGLNKTIHYSDLNDCFKEKNCLAKIGSAVKFEGEFYKKTSTSLFFKNKNSDIELYLPNSLYFKTSALEEGALYKIKGVLEKPDADFRILATGEESLALVQKNKEKTEEENSNSNSKPETNTKKEEALAKVELQKAVRQSCSPLIKKPIAFENKLKIIENNLENKPDKFALSNITKEDTHTLMIKILKVLAGII